MTDVAAIREAVARVQMRLLRVRRVRAALVAGGAALAVVALLQIASHGMASRGAPPSALAAWAAGLLVAAVAFAVQMARWRPITLARAALWCEEQQSTGYALVTAVEVHDAAWAPGVAARLVARCTPVLGEDGPARRALRALAVSAWRGPAIALAVATTGLLAALWWRGTAEAGARAAEASVTQPDNADAAHDAAAVALAPWRVIIRTPPYAGGAERVAGDLTTVSALVGSVVEVQARGTRAPTAVQWIGGDVGLAPVPAAEVTVRDTLWTVRVRMPLRPQALRLREGRDERVLTLVPVPDSLPVVRLLAPLNDTVSRDTTGTLVLSAEAHDDLGLQSARFELIVTSGSGERYEARTVTLGAKAVGGARRTALAAAVTYRELGLGAGDVVHVRAVARDAHPMADREFGVSETRSLRIARADEYDSVAVDAAPPPAVDSSLLSQRMLLLLTERLEARRPTLPTDALVRESRRLAVEQARIRRAVSAVLFERLTGDGESEHVHYEGDGHDHGVVVQDGKLVPSASGGAVRVMPGATPPPGVAPTLDAGGDSPIIGINRPLLEAYNAMWDAGRALELAEPAAAIPPMRLALEAIQRARAAERVYLRGRTRPVVVDIARVRLAGRDTGQSSVRKGAAAPVPPGAQHDARLVRAAAMLTRDAESARDSLLVLRLDVLREAPALAEAIDDALAALARGDDATAALVRARRSVSPVTRSRGVSAWSTP